MEFPDWRLLILLGVFVAGWAIARVDMRQVLSSAKRIPERLMDGIGSLMQGDQVAAAQGFLATAKLTDSDDARLHFYAGELYRKQGDYEAAIRIHKNLLDQTTLDASTHSRARLELGLDYQQAGFLDLAEQCFRALGDTSHASIGVRHLFNIHLISRDWKQAIADEERFASDDSDPELRRNVIAQLYCEWAQEAEPARREELIDIALQRNPNCGRAWLMKAEDALERTDISQAQRCLDMLRARTDMLPLCADLLMRTHAAAGTPATGEKILSEAFERNPSELLFTKAYEALDKVKGVSEVGAFTERGMRLLHGALPVSKWLQAQSAHAVGDRREMCERILRTLGEQPSVYHCHNCAFSSPTHYWQCPLCRLWETMGDVSVTQERS